MEPLFIPATKATPEISFNPKTESFLIAGRSIPADATDFYTRLEKWTDNFIQIQKSDSVTIDIKLDHLNTGSVRSLLSILSRIIKLRDHNVNVMINWHHDVEDEDMVDKGEEMSLILEHPFRFVPFRETDN
jgi:hypothetical protein